MKSVKRILSIMMVLSLVLSLIGCAKCIDTEYKDVTVRVVDKDYTPASSKRVYRNKKWKTKRTPAKYKIVVEYEGVNYTLTDSDTYEDYKDSVGTDVLATLRIRTYDDGSIKYNIESLGIN